MLLFLQAMLTFAGLMLASLFVTYYVNVLHQQSDRHPEPTLSNVIMLQTTLLVTTIVDAAGDVVSLATSSAFTFASNSVRNGKKFALLAAIALFLVEVSSNTSLVLSSTDSFYRCALQPLFENVLLFWGQFIRLFYDLLIPTYNYYYVVLSQATSGTIAIAVKCDLSSVVGTVRLFIEMLVAIFQSVFYWSGTGEMSVENNIFVNELNVTEVFVKAQGIVAHQQSISTCVCEGLKDVIDIAFVLFRQKELPLAINHLFNFLVSAIQTVFQLLPTLSKFPTLQKPLYHLNGFIFYTGKYLDRVLEDGLKKTIALFIDNFRFQRLPREFVFTTTSRLLMTGTHFLHSLYRITIHIMLPLPNYITNVDYMMKAFRIDQSIRQLDLYLYNTANIWYWGAEIIDKFANELVDTAANDGSFDIVGIPDHVQVNCGASDKWTVALACIPYLTATLPINVLYVAWNFATEVLWKSVFTQQQNLLRTIQRYDGPSYPRDVAVTCAYRRNITWDMTTTGECKCDVPYDYQEAVYTPEHPFGVPTYDPFCGQPNLQANVFGNIDRITQLMSSASSISDKYKFFTHTSNLLTLEFWRSIIKFALNLPDILEGKYFDRKVNCGYGVSELALERWWEEQGEEINECSPPKSGYAFLRASFGRNAYLCEPIHDHIRFMMCSVTTNKRGGDELCTEENKEGCMCNIGLPLNDTSLCSCIYTFPDDEQEVTQTAFSNPVLKGIYNHSVHWCNTYHFEWGLYYTDRLALAVDYFFEDLHPAYDTAESSYCEDKSYELGKTSILRYTEGEFNQQKALYDALAVAYTTDSCSLYGSHDIICSASMTVRNAVRLITYEVRELEMTLFELIGGSTSGLTINLGNRLCDLQRTAAGLASTISAFLAGLGNDGMRVGVAKILFSLLDAPIEALNMLNTAVQFLGSVLDGTAGFDKGIEQPGFNFIITEMDILINWLRGLLQGFETLFEAVVRGGGAFFRTLDTILVIVRNLLNDVAMEIIVLMMKVFAGVIEMFTGGGVYTEFFDDLWSLITKAITMVMKNAGKVLDAIMQLLGPVGQFIRDISGDICNSLQGVLCTLTFGDFCDMGCIGFEAASYSAPPSLGEAAEATGDFFSDLFGRRRLHSSIDALPSILHNELEWNGTSDCDLYVHAYRDYNMSDLRPIERVQLLRCVNQRSMAANLAKTSGIPIPHDIIYNWKRKYIVGYHLVLSGQLYVTHLVGDLDAQALVYEMKKAGIDDQLFLPFWRQVRNGVQSAFRASNVNHFVHTLFHHFDPNIQTNNRTWGNIYRIYDHTSKAAASIYNATYDKDVHEEINRISRVVVQTNLSWPSLPEHVTSGMKYRAKATLRASNTRNPSKLKARNLFLKAAGLNTDVTPCDEQENTNVCVNCLVVDNFLNTVINEGNRMRKYYTYTFIPIVIPSFVDYFEDEEREARAKARRADVANMMDEAADAAIEDMDDWSEEQFDAFNKGYKLKHKLRSNTTYLSPFDRAAKDWEYLFANFQFRNNVKFIELLTTFISTTDDEYVPYFAHTLSWYVTYPFAGQCSMETIYCNSPGYETTSKRLDKITTSLFYMLYFIFAIAFVEWWLELSVLSVLSPYLHIVFFGIYMLTVYGYIFPCFPNIPNCLIDDIYSYLNDRLFPDCFCTVYPNLATSCNADNCFLCSFTTTYETCSDNIPLLRDLGLLWAPLMWIRVQYPSLLLFVYNTIPFMWFARRDKTLDPVFQQVIENIPPSDLEQECMRVHMSDVVVMVIVAYAATKVLSLVVPIAARIGQHAFKIVLLVAGLLYSMAVSIELSTIGGVKNTFQKD